AGAAAAVGHDGGGPLHHRFPVGVGHVGDQDVAGLHPVHLGDRPDHLGHAGADALADGTALAQDLAPTLQVVALDGGGAGTRLHRLGPGLHDEQLTGDAVLRPLDVHRAAVVLLDDHRLAGQRLDFRVVQAEAVLLVCRHRHHAHAFA